jgi:hypothetical protein
MDGVVSWIHSREHKSSNTETSPIDVDAYETPEDSEKTILLVDSQAYIVCATGHNLSDGRWRDPAKGNSTETKNRGRVQHENHRFVLVNRTSWLDKSDDATRLWCTYTPVELARLMSAAQHNKEY